MSLMTIPSEGNVPDDNPERRELSLMSEIPGKKSWGSSLMSDDPGEKSRGRSLMSDGPGEKSPGKIPDVQKRGKTKENQGKITKGRLFIS